MMFDVDSNRLLGYQCYCSHMTTTNSTKNTLGSSSANGPLDLEFFEIQNQQTPIQIISEVKVQLSALKC